MTILSLMAGFHPTYTSRCSTFIPRFLFPSFAFVVEFWVCLTFLTQTTMLGAHLMIFCFRVLGLLSISGFVWNDLTWTFHTHTTLFSRFFLPEFRFCSRILGLFGLISPQHTIRTHLDAQRSPHVFLFPSFGFVVDFWASLDWSHVSAPHTRTHARTRAHTHIHTHHNAQRSPHEFLFPSFGFVGTNLIRCTKKKLYLSSFSIPILIFNFSTQTRYRWNRYHSQIVNIVFLNYLVQNKLFLYFAFPSLLGTKGSPLDRVSVDRECN